jgi:hypothetical protein
MKLSTVRVGWSFIQRHSLTIFYIVLTFNSLILYYNSGLCCQTEDLYVIRLIKCLKSIADDNIYVIFMKCLSIRNENINP